MKIIPTFVLIFLLITVFQVEEGCAESSEKFDSYMQQWDEKRELATQYLLQAEKYLKEGDELSGCSSQEKASKYGIEATQALINAMKINDSTEGIQDLKAGLNKWKELGDFCS